MARIPPPKTRKGSPPPLPKTIGNLDKPEPTGLTPMNFKVREDFHREFKLFAVQRGMSMVDVLHEAFRLLKEKGR